MARANTMEPAVLFEIRIRVSHVLLALLVLPALVVFALTWPSTLSLLSMTNQALSIGFAVANMYIRAHNVFVPVLGKAIQAIVNFGTQ